MVVKAEAAQLDQRVTFKREVLTPNGMGGQTRTFATIATVWANVRPMSGREREQSMRLDAQSNYVFTIRPRTDIDEKTIAEWSGVNFNIRFAPPAPRAQFMYLEAERGVAI